MVYTVCLLTSTHPWVYADEMKKHPELLERAILSRDQARQFLGGVSLPTLDRLIHTGRLRVIRIGRRRFIAKTELDRFITESTA